MPENHSPPVPDEWVAADPLDAAAPRFWAVLPCAGNGSRAVAPSAAGSTPALVLQAGLPKQYQQIAGQPMVIHTLAAFASVPRISQTLVAVSAGDGFWGDQSVLAQVQIASCGGPTRAATVLGALKVLLLEGAKADDWVLVHDAARCLVLPAQIEALIDACQHDAVGGLLAHALPDTLKSAQTSQLAAGTDLPHRPRVAATLDRAGKWLAQTPQMFRLQALIDAMEHAGPNMTDESSAMEAMGHAPLLVPGSAQNFKVTYPDDFALAEAVLSYRTRVA